MKNSKYILVTGGEGYIGNAICNFLVKKRKRVVSIDNLSNSIRKKKKQIIFKKIDLKNKKKLEEIFKIYKFETIIHLAAKINARESNIKKKEYYENNYLYGKNLISLAKKYKIKFFLFASSAAVYGSYKTKFKENDKKKPINAYGEYKLLFENFISKSKILHANLRFFNICGANASLNVGQIKNSGVVKRLCNCVKKNSVFHIHGNDFPTKDGHAVRDYLHINDLNNIIYKSIIFLKNNNKNLTINCGSGKGTSIKQLIHNYSNKRLKIKIGKRINGDPAEVISDIDMLKQVLKYRPKYSAIKNIINSSMKWENYINKK
jgi:UDP-glucose 4-epimerase